MGFYESIHAVKKYFVVALKLIFVKILCIIYLFIIFVKFLTYSNVNVI